MKLKELKAYVDKAVSEDHGDSLVLFDTEARHFQCHVVDVTSAFLEEGVIDENKIFILYNNEHPHSECERHDYLSNRIKAAETPLLARIEELEKERMSQCAEFVRGLTESSHRNEELEEMLRVAGPTWIAHDPHSSVYDSSQFAVALQVKNADHGKTEWEIATVCVSADKDIFSITYLDEFADGAAYDAWSWEDFEFVIPLNSEARMTVRDFGRLKPQAKEPV